MEVAVAAEAHQVTQQAGLIDLRAGVADLDGGPVRLPGHRAIALEQVGHQRLLHRLFVELCGQQLRGRQVVLAVQVQAVQVDAVEFVDGLGIEAIGKDQLDPDALTAGGAEVVHQVAAHLVGTFEARHVEAVEVELDRLALHDPGRFAGHGQLHQRHLRPAPRGQPGQLEGRPEVRTGEGQGRIRAQSQGRPLRGAGKGKQLCRIVVVRVRDRPSQLGIGRAMGFMCGWLGQAGITHRRPDCLAGCAVTPNCGGTAPMRGVRQVGKPPIRTPLEKKENFLALY